MKITQATNKEMNQGPAKGWRQIRHKGESRVQSLMIGHSVVNNSFLVFNAARLPSLSDSFVQLHCLCCMENNSDTETLWPEAKTWRVQGEDQNSLLSLGYFVWDVSARQYFCHFGLSFIPTARHTWDTCSYYHSQVNFEILTKEATNSKAVEGVSGAPRSLYISTSMGTSSGPYYCLPFT